MRIWLALGVSVSLASCSWTGSSSGKDDLGMYPLRTATREEGAALKKCLRLAYAQQVAYRKKWGRGPSRIAELNTDKACSDFRMKLEPNEESDQIEITAQLTEGESNVKWSVNEQGVIEEHADPDQEMDLEF